MAKNDDIQQNTFWEHFYIVEHISADAIRDVYDGVFRQWTYSSNDDCLIDLIVLLDYKRHIKNEKHPEYTKLYSDLYIKAKMFAQEHLKDDSLKRLNELVD